MPAACACFAYVGAEDNRKGIPFVKIVSLLCKLIQFLMVCIVCHCPQSLDFTCFSQPSLSKPCIMRVSGIFIFSYNSQITLINHKHMSHLYLNKMSQICLKSDMSQIIRKNPRFNFEIFLRPEICLTEKISDFKAWIFII